MQARGLARLPRRSKREWGVRVVLALLAAMLGLVSVTATLANVIVKIAPERAHALSPGNGVITAALARQRFEVGLQSDIDSEPARLARLALRQDPTAAEALTVLAFQAQLRADVEEARNLFAYSLTLSRRELQPRIWAIEESVMRGDITGALQNYDIALRTSRRAPDMLFPILASAIAEPQVRSRLIEILSDGPDWGRSFVYYVGVSGSDPEATVAFYREGERAGLPIEDIDRAAVVNGLIAHGLFGEAWDYYASFRSGVEPSRSRDPDFLLATEVRAQFDWQATDDAALFASFVTDGKDGRLDFSAPAGIGGVLLQQMQMLPPGTYRIEGHSTGIDESENALPFWRLACGDGRELGRVVMPNSAQSGGAFAGHLSVPADCEVQVLSLVARSSSRIGGMIGQIERVQLVPADISAIGGKAR